MHTTTTILTPCFVEVGRACRRNSKTLAKLPVRQSPLRSSPAPRCSRNLHTPPELDVHSSLFLLNHPRCPLCFRIKLFRCTAFTSSQMSERRRRREGGDLLVAGRGVGGNGVLGTGEKRDRGAGRKAKAEAQNTGMPSTLAPGLEGNVAGSSGERMSRLGRGTAASRARRRHREGSDRVRMHCPAHRARELSKS